MNSRPIRTYRHVRDVPQLSEAEVERLSAVEAKYAFRANSYYLNLIDWDNPEDPLRRLILPTMSELNMEGDLDASRETDYTVARGLQHKYSDTALMLVAETCDSYCRYCFRKRLTMRRSDEIAVDPTEALTYIREHQEVRNVLLTGGDPLTLATGKLERILAALSEMEHLKGIRIGSKILAFRPQRVLDDPSLLEMLRRHSRPDRRLYLIAHFTHPHELTVEAREAVRLVKQAGCEIMNQTPLIRGVNDRSDILQELLLQLTAAGVHPYYLFVGRPTRGNRTFLVPIVEAWQILMEASNGLPGLARTVRLAMSHHTGKLEITGVDHDFIYLRYHRAADPHNRGRHLVCQRDDRAVWLDELHEVHPRPSLRDYHEPARAPAKRIPMRLDRLGYSAEPKTREN